MKARGFHKKEKKGNCINRRKECLIGANKTRKEFSLVQQAKYSVAIDGGANSKERL